MESVGVSAGGTKKERSIKSRTSAVLGTAPQGEGRSTREMCGESGWQQGGPGRGYNSRSCLDPRISLSAPASICSTGRKSPDPQWGPVGEAASTLEDGRRGAARRLAAWAHGGRRRESSEGTSSEGTRRPRGEGAGTAGSWWRPPPVCCSEEWGGGLK
jgi:hypothetical protein